MGTSLPFPLACPAPFSSRVCFLSMHGRVCANKMPFARDNGGTISATRDGSNRARLVRVPPPDNQSEGFEKLLTILTGAPPQPCRPRFSAALGNSNAFFTMREKRGAGWIRIKRRAPALDPLTEQGIRLKALARDPDVKRLLARRHQPMPRPAMLLVQETDATANVCTPGPGTVDLSRGSLAAAGSPAQLGAGSGAFSTVPMLLQLVAVSDNPEADPGSTRRHTPWLSDGVHVVTAYACATQHHKVLPRGADTHPYGLWWVTKHSAIGLPGGLWTLLVHEARPPVGYARPRQAIGEPTDITACTTVSPPAPLPTPTPFPVLGASTSAPWCHVWADRARR